MEDDLDSLPEPTLEEKYAQSQAEYAKLQLSYEGAKKDAVKWYESIVKMQGTIDVQAQLIRKMEKHIDMFEKWIDRLTVGIATARKPSRSI